MKKYLPILRTSPFFKGLTDNEILSILHCVNAATISRKRDSYIFRAGDSTEVMGLVVSGCVLVMQLIGPAALALLTALVVSFLMTPGLASSSGRRR